MTNAGMLAHLRDRFRVPAENLATEALAYVLENERARDAFNGCSSALGRTCLTWSGSQHRISAEMKAEFQTL
jgi:hypothetical protein